MGYCMAAFCRICHQLKGETSITMIQPLIQLRDKFCDLYPDQEDAVRIAEDAGLAVTAVRLSGKAINTWHEILKEAVRREKIGALVYIVGEAYENHKATLTALFLAYQEQNEQAPTRYTERRIIHLLPFAKNKGKVRLLEIPRLRAHRDVSEMLLNYAIEKGAKSVSARQWHNQWKLPMKGEGTPVTGDGVTILYDLLEWLVVQEIAAYGDHVYAGEGGLRPGDDFDNMPQGVVRLPRADLFPRGIRPNYLWQYGHQAAEQKLKLPPATTMALEPLPPKHGVAAYGNEAVRKLVIRNPVGSLTIIPSQIWCEATSNQARSMLRKIFADYPTMYPLELQLLTTVVVQPGATTSAQAAWSAGAYERWLLELQEQMVRHMDWERYVEADYRRMVVKLAEALDARSGQEGESER